MSNELESQIRELIDRGARPVSLLEASQRSARSAPRRAGRRRTLITVAAAGVVTAGCAAGLAVAFASPGAPSRPAAQASPSGKPSALTAAMIRHVAAASSSALEASGQEQISYRSVKDGTVTSAGTDTVTYSASDWNYAVHVTAPSGIIDGTSRGVDGQYYLQGGAGARWLHEAGWSTTPAFPEAATLVRLLSPAAGFQNAGTDAIGGQRLTRLHATRVSELPRSTTLVRYASLTNLRAPATAGTLTGLDVWVDGTGVVRQMRIGLDGDDGPTTVTVTFTDSGQPQSITAPPTS